MFLGCSGLTSLDVSGFNTANVTSMSYMFLGCSGLTSLDVSGFKTDNVTDMRYMFSGCSSLTSLDVSGFNTANVTEMYGMFDGCSGLASLDVSGFKTDNVTNMSGMFYGCSGLKTIYSGSGWTTNAVTDGNDMFSLCTSLVGGAGTPYDENHTDYTYAHIDGGTSNPGYFTDKNATPVVDIAAKPTFAWEGDNLAISTTTEGASIYYAVKEFITEPSGNGSLSSPYNVAAALQYINTLDADTPSPDSVYIRGVVAEIREISKTYGNATFYITDDGRTTGDRLLAYRVLNVGNQRFTTENAFQVGDEVIIRGIVCNYRGTTPETYQNAAYIYAYTTPEMNMLYENPIAVTDNVIVRAKATKQGMNDSEMAMFSVGSEPYAVLSENNTKLTFFYDDQKEARGGMSVGPFSGSYDYDRNRFVTEAGWDENRENIKTVVFDSSFTNDTTLTSTAYWFSDCRNLTSIEGVAYLKTNKIEDMSDMFLGCSGLTNLDVSGFNTSNVKNMESMFNGCSGLTSLDVSNFNTTNVTDMSGMFCSCTQLKSLDLRNFNTENVTDMGMMFQNCYAMENLNVRSFNTSKVTSMFQMFLYCYSLHSLDVSSFNTENVRSMRWMFGGCSGLESIDVSHFNTSNVSHMGEMFNGCSNLRNIDVSNFNTQSLTNMWMMFAYCTNLTHVDISNFNTQKLENLKRVFEGSYNLVSINMSNFTTTNVTDFTDMFIGCSSLASIQAGSAFIPDSIYAQAGNPNLLVYVNEARLAPSNVQNVVINGLAREIVLTDAQDGNNDWYAPQAFVAERISYTRNFGQSTTKGTSRGWESIALPFDVQTIQHESKGVIAPFNNSASNKHFWLRRLTDNGLQAATSIEANTPYIISMPNSEEYTSDYNLNGRVTFSAQNIDVPATAAKVLALADSSIVMVPAMQRQSRSSSVWALNVGEVRGQYFEGSVFERDYRTVRPFEAYTIHRQENGQPAPRYVPIQEIAGVTGIETIDREPLTLNQWYDMQGRKLEGKPARKGVYISNGKKVVVK